MEQEHAASGKRNPRDLLYVQGYNDGKYGRARAYPDDKNYVAGYEQGVAEADLP